jgi:deoxyribonuclease-4
VLRVTRGYRVSILIEITAGQGTCLGSSFDELAWLLREIGSPRRTGVCFDTCHAFAAGYDWRGGEGYERMWREFDAKVGIDKIQAFHLNDSKREPGSARPRSAASCATLASPACPPSSSSLPKRWRWA